MTLDGFFPLESSVTTVASEHGFPTTIPRNMHC